jgi:hypothetical protein
MPTLFSGENLRRHWSGMLWILPALVVGMIYNSRHLAERVRVPHPPGEQAYEHHLTPLTTFLGSALFWIFWGGIAAFVVQAAWHRKRGAFWFWAKVLFIPVWLLLNFLLFFHVE